MKIRLDRYFAYIIVVAIVPILVICSTSGNVRADSLNPQVYSTGESPFGIPYSDWVARWWTWAFGLRSDFHNPAFQCNTNQSGAVFFLPDPLAPTQTHSCTIPHDKAILVPLVTGALTTFEAPGATDQELMNRAGICDSTSDLRLAKVDGTTIKGLDQDRPYRTNSSKVFPLNIPEMSQYNLGPGKTRIFADGWFLFLKPLQKGDHVVKVGGNIPFAPNPTDVNSQCGGGVTYTWNLKVE